MVWLVVVVVVVVATVDCCDTEFVEEEVGTPLPASRCACVVAVVGGYGLLDSDMDDSIDSHVCSFLWFSLGSWLFFPWESSRDLREEYR